MTAPADPKALVERLLVPNPCSICRLPITENDGSFVGTGDGTMRDGGSFAHYACYWRAQAEALATRLAEVERRLREAQERLADADSQIYDSYGDGKGSMDDDLFARLTAQACHRHTARQQEGGR